MSRAFSSDNTIQGKRVMNASVKLVLFLTIPATVGMIVLARPIVDVAFSSTVYSLNKMQLIQLQL